MRENKFILAGITKEIAVLGKGGGGKVIKMQSGEDRVSIKHSARIRHRHTLHQ